MEWNIKKTKYLSDNITNHSLKVKIKNWFEINDNARRHRYSNKMQKYNARVTFMRLQQCITLDKVFNNNC